MNVCESLNHTKWECKYHVVFIPKYRRKVLFGKWRPHLGKMFRELARQQECEIEEGHLMVDHVHRLMTIPPKYAVSQVVGYLKGKSAIHRALDEGGKCGFGLALGVVAQELLVGLIVHSLDSTRRKRNPTEIVAASIPELYAPTDEKSQRMRERSIPHFAKYGIPASRPPGAPRLQRFLALTCHRPYVGFMAAEPDEMRELPPPTPAPVELCERAAALVRSHPECFWFRHPEARIRHLEDVRLVVEHLREYGDRHAWWDAQDLHKCLSPLYKKTS